MVKGIRLAAGFCFLNSEQEIRKKFLPIAHNFDYCACIDGRFEGYDPVTIARNRVYFLRKKASDKDLHDNAWGERIQKRLDRALDLLYEAEIEHEKNPPEPYSTDKGPELLAALPNCEVIRFAGYQPDKRQKYFDACEGKNIDYLIGWDSDEYVHPDHNNWELLRKNIEINGDKYPNEHLFFMWYWATREWKKAGNKFRNYKWLRSIRVWRNPANMKFAFGGHFWYMLKGQPEDGSVTNLKAYIGHEIDGVRITADSHDRTPEQLRLRRAWAKWGWEKEQEYLRKKMVEIWRAPGGMDNFLAALNALKPKKKRPTLND